MIYERTSGRCRTCSETIQIIVYIEDCMIVMVTI
jgi:hypothetical protein